MESWTAAAAPPEDLKQRNRRLGVLLVLVLGSLYALAIWGVVVLN
jgi:hypothetical protein